MNIKSPSLTSKIAAYVLKEQHCQTNLFVSWIKGGISESLHS